jgi:ABC-type tungstate transport system permease subunit
MAKHERTLLLIAFAAALLGPVAAQGDPTTGLTVVGSAEPVESGLIHNVLEPEFRLAFPQYSFNYVASSTKNAVALAENGTGGPSVLLGDSPALESPFVARGFSDNGQPGSAVFDEDFVLAGSTGDPAGVKANASHDVAAAFADIAAAGVAKSAAFISRGGTTTAPFSTLAEHGIWALVNRAGLTPAGVVLCNVSEADGGGMTPIDPSKQATSGEVCPESGTVVNDVPNWYEIKSGNEMNKLTQTNACVSTSNGATQCYALTDHGTFDDLAAGTPDAVPNMEILDGDNAASAAGGAEALLRYFHAYVINPAKPEETVNLQAAQDFLGLLTSPALQSRVSNYLTEPGGGPFAATAALAVSATPSSTSVNAGGSISVSGALFNPEPGFPALAGQSVAVDLISATDPQPLASGLSNAAGQYTLPFTPPVSGSYEVAAGPLSQVEIAGLEPPFSDVLSAAASTPFAVTVNPMVAPTTAVSPSGPVKTIPAAIRVAFKRVTVRHGSLTVSGMLSSAPKSRGSSVRLLVRKGLGLTSSGKIAATGGKSHTFNVLAKVMVKSGRKSFSVSCRLARGFHYSLRLEYVVGGKVAARSAIRNITVR